MNRIVKRMAVPVGAAIILGSSGFAFMASNSQLPSSAGYSSQSINGFQVSKIHYIACEPLDGNYCGVQFELTPENGLAPANSGSNVQASVNGNDFHYCRYSGNPGSDPGTLWTCDVNVSSVDLQSLQISAAQ